jgi:hypothetical protein
MDGVTKSRRFLARNPLTACFRYCLVRRDDASYPRLAEWPAYEFPRYLAAPHDAAHLRHDSESHYVAALADLHDAVDLAGLRGGDARAVLGQAS